MDGEGVIILQRAAEVLVTNGTGARLLELVKEGLPVATIVDRLVDEYDVDRATATTDINAFVAELLAAGALAPVEEGP